MDKQACHFYHLGKCENGSACRFSHNDQALGICPNGNQCLIADHSKIQCPLQESCPHQNEICTFIHPPKQQKKFTDAQYQEIINPKDDDQQQQQQQNKNVFEEEKKQPYDIQLMNQQNNEDKDSENQQFLSRLLDFHKDFVLFKPFENKLIQRTNLDLVFIMDCTASMDKWIEACKNELKTIVDYILSEHEGTKIRIAFIGYRDFCDKERYIWQDFTEEIDIIKGIISGIQADGGGDFPEDLTGALHIAINTLNWQARAKYCIIITDAPCHGKKYHKLGKDDYINGDPEGKDPEEIIKQMAKLNINIYAIRIPYRSQDSQQDKYYTHKMYDVLSQAYQTVSGKPIGITDLGNSTQSFGFYIACTVSATISQSVMGTQVTIFKRALQMLKDQKRDQEIPDEEKMMNRLQTIINDELQQELFQAQQIQQIMQQALKFELMTEPPQWDNLQQSQEFEAIGQTFFIKKEIDQKINWKKPLIQSSSVQTKIRICSKPFAQGSMRYAFYAMDTLIGQKMVAKLPKIIDDGMHYSIDEMCKDLESVFICQHIVNEFNERIIHYLPSTNLLLSFAYSYIYQLKNDKVKYKLWYGENFIEGQYKKFNNNDGWFNKDVTESSLISQALSHFSWQITQGYLMIVDLQGVTGMLTDPQIHCLDYKRFGKGNNGYEGIIKFFVTHKCNNYCNKLNLLHPRINSYLPENFNFFEKQIPPMPEDREKQVSAICDLCRQAFKLKAKSLYHKIVNQEEKYCPDCDKKRTGSMKKGVCVDCNAEFRSSQYWFLMKRTDFPIRCSECRKKRRELLRKQLEEDKDQI